VWVASEDTVYGPDGNDLIMDFQKGQPGLGGDRLVIGLEDTLQASLDRLGWEEVSDGVILTVDGDKVPDGASFKDGDDRTLYVKGLKLTDLFGSWFGGNMFLPPTVAIEYALWNGAGTTLLTCTDAISCAHTPKVDQPVDPFDIGYCGKRITDTPNGDYIAPDAPAFDPLQPWNPDLQATKGDDTIRIDGGNDTVNAGSGDDTVIAQDGGSGDDSIVGGAGNDWLDGGVDNDQVFGGTGDDTLVGGEGDDKLYGESGDDSLCGGGGSDTLYGGDGGDRMDGGDEEDWLFGGDGNDSLYGGLEADTLYGGGDDDSLCGGADNDVMYGDDAAAGGPGGEDTLFGGLGNDTLYGGDGDDCLFGNEGKDELHGGAQNDYLCGGAEQDVLFGEGESDTLDGGAGTDWLYGGAGSDRFVYELTLALDAAGAPIASAGSGNDFIDDFAEENGLAISPAFGGDRLVLRITNLAPSDGPGLDELGTVVTVTEASLPLAMAGQVETVPGVLLGFGNGDQLFLARVTSGGGWPGDPVDSLAELQAALGVAIEIECGPSCDLVACLDPWAC
jgi:Ca2+-binding RTX toxin-like protein